MLPIGATRPTPVNIRVIAATHCDLEALVRERRFRDDLYYRLNGAHIVLPPLRERRDLAWLIQRMLGECAKAAGRSEAPRLSSEVSERLHAHAWPGNLRELRNVIEFACAMGADGVIEVPDLPDGWANVDQAHQRTEVNPTSSSITNERARLLGALETANGNVSAAARLLGVSRMTLYRHLRKSGIELSKSASRTSS